MDTIKAHPITNIFPMMTDGELSQLAADIKANGLQVPITTYENMVLDGRNRLRACEMAGIEPRFVEWEGDSPTLWVISMNLHRRHLTPSQRAAIAVEALPIFEAEARERQLATLKHGSVFVCPDCAETFDRPVWHCPVCAHHWLFNRIECFNCHEYQRPVSPKLDERGRSDKQVATIFNVARGYVAAAKKLSQEVPELFQAVRDGETTLQDAKREARRQEKERGMRDKPSVPPSDRCRLYNADFRQVDIEAESVDCIITDPPYPREYLPLYDDLANLAARVLKPGGSLVVMVGQSYLPEILALMVPHITYRWTFAYMTPGPTTTIWQRHVNTNWKPVLWFVKGESPLDWAGTDVFRSERRDKDFHEWGQSESGMAQIIERFTVEGDAVFDPFMGAGTTGVVALQLGRRFIGADNDEVAYHTATRRLGIDQG